jgi:hypothetical protein
LSRISFPSRIIGTIGAFKGKRPQEFGGQRRGGKEDNIYRPTTAGDLEQVKNAKHEPNETALETLGERESETGKLEEAVAAYREALKEWTRERVPLQWA